VMVSFTKLCLLMQLSFKFQLLSTGQPSQGYLTCCSDWSGPRCVTSRKPNYRLVLSLDEYPFELIDAACVCLLALEVIVGASSETSVLPQS